MQTGSEMRWLKASKKKMLSLTNFYEQNYKYKYFVLDVIYVDQKIKNQRMGTYFRQL